MQRQPLTETIHFLLLFPLQKCQPRTSVDATRLTCLIIRNQGLERARRHHRHHLRSRCPVCHRHHHHDPIPWHPHRARESSPNNPRMRRGPAFSGLDVPVSASPSFIYTRHPAFQTSQSSCCSHLPGVSRQCIPHRSLPPRLVNVKTRNPSAGQSRRSPAAHLSTGLLAQRFLTCSGRRGRFCFECCCRILTEIDSLLSPSLPPGFPAQIHISPHRTPRAQPPP